MIVGYIRVSTDTQVTSNQKNEILNYAHELHVKVDKFIDVTMSSRKNMRDRLIDDLFTSLSLGDMLIISELSRLGRSTQEVLQTIEKLMSIGVELHIIKQKMVINPNNKNDFVSKAMITLMSLFSELERDLISQRTTEALKARKAQGVVLGKPKGTTQKSKYDAHVDRIVELHTLGLSLNKIVSNHLEPVMGKGNCSVASLSVYLKRRGLVK
ncbi:recombinase family protein [Sulfurospirillum sp. UCH001]|uniref:recombinase family protein n=1 Tax=Sulfurospirillum sp. UCH001 TaxID=1581011 RepID=UPI0008334B4B|nr:recombinase family protein [Sulfurospirillum sp. UCH001]